ncbi:hypothetical protein Tco_0269001 [Tanacetum coccineum]
MASTSMKGSRVAVGHDYDGVVGVEGDDGGSRGGGGRRYTKVELARLLDEGCRRHYAVTSDDRITYTARELRAIAKERNVSRYTIYLKSELFEILGFNSVAGA